MKVVYFRNAAELGRWFRKNHASATELWVGFYKKGSGKASITWPESVEEALCVGWIDGIRKSVDGDRYTNRFTPRKARSVWSAVNIAKARALEASGRMRPEGLEAFRARKENRSGIYSYEQRRDRLEEPYQAMLRKNRKAWTFFENQPASYRKVAGWWVVSARKEETRIARLRKLSKLSAQGLRLPEFERRKPGR